MCVTDYLIRIVRSRSGGSAKSEPTRPTVTGLFCQLTLTLNLPNVYAPATALLLPKTKIEGARLRSLPARASAIEHFSFQRFLDLRNPPKPSETSKNSETRELRNLCYESPLGPARLQTFQVTRRRLPDSQKSKSLLIHLSHLVTFCEMRRKEIKNKNSL